MNAHLVTRNVRCSSQTRTYRSSLSYTSLATQLMSTVAPFCTSHTTSIHPIHLFDQGNAEILKHTFYSQYNLIKERFVIRLCFRFRSITFPTCIARSINVIKTLWASPVASKQFRKRAGCNLSIFWLSSVTLTAI